MRVLGSDTADLHLRSYRRRREPLRCPTVAQPPGWSGLELRRAAVTFPSVRISTNPASAQTVRLECRLRGEYIAHGSGFLVAAYGRPGFEGRYETLLVTAWHVVTGKQPLDPRRSASGIPDTPDEIIVRVPFQQPTRPTLTSDPFVGEESFTIRPREARWYEHPARRELGVDLVALPVDLPENRDRPLRPLSGDDALGAGVQVGSSLFIVGHPLRYSTGVFPTWKRASVATEPTLDFEGQPCFLVDSRTTSGMSGSPVYEVVDDRVEDLTQAVSEAFRRLPYSDAGSYRSVFNNPRVIADPLRLAGVYTARASDGDEELDRLGLGKVWRLESLVEMLGISFPPASGFDPDGSGG